MLTTEEYPPWSGGGGKYAIPAVLEEVKRTAPR
jgi:ATP-dependent Lhr-like helicase